MQVVAAQRRMKTVVVVADNSLIVDAIAIGLENSGEFKLLGQINGRTGEVESILEGAPDVVLVDDMRCSACAVEVVRDITAKSERTAVIMLTISMEPEWLDSVFDSGAAGVISKATHPGALPTLIRETLNGHIIHVYKGSRARHASMPGFSAGAQASLTAREREVLQLVAGGATNGEIARKLWVTQQTVKFHLSNVYRKLEVGNRTEASRYAHLNGLLAAPEPAVT